MLSKFRPPLRIHVWGGLGSQLYAWSLYLELSERFPRRKLLLVFHNSGVTKRDPEIARYFGAESVQIVFDFKAEAVKAPSINVKGHRERSARRYLAICLTRIGFLSSCDDIKSVSDLKPWVCEIRGHYSYRRIPVTSAITIHNVLIGKTSMSSALDFIGVHDRLGDLLSLESKGPVAAESVINAVDTALLKNHSGNIRVFSDSIEVAIARLQTLSEFAEVEFCEGDARSAISELLHSRCFVGTSSKISIWIVIFRNYLDADTESLMPRNLRENLILNIGDNKKISYY